MMDVRLLELPGLIDPDVLHHPQIAVRDEVAVEHDVADEAFITGPHDYGRAWLDQDSVEPLTGKAGIKRIEAGAGRVGPVLALGIAD